MKENLLLTVFLFFLQGAEAQTATEWFKKGESASDQRVKIECFTQALKLGCSLPAAAYNNRGVAKINLGRYKEAIEDFDQSINIKSENPSAYANRGYAKNEMGKPADAIRDYKRSINYESHDAKVWAYLGLAEMAQKNFEKAIGAFNKAIEANPEYAPAYNYRGVVYENLGRLKEALEDYKTAIRQDPNFSDAYNNRGYIYLQQKNSLQALRDYDKSIELGGPGYEPARKYRDEALAQLRTQKDQTPPAIRWVTTSQTVEYKYFNVQACIESATELKETSLYVNGVLYGSPQRGVVLSGGSAACPNKIDRPVSLIEGENRISIQAENAAGVVNGEEIVIRYIAPKPKPYEMNGTSLTGNAERRIAMVVGNAVYPGGGTLLNPGNDARDMENVLTELGFKVMKYDNLARQEMDNHIQEFVDSLKNYEVGLFYYSGHGVEVDGLNYMLPVDISAKLDKADIPYKCVPADWVEQKMSDAGAENKTCIVILDACRNNPFRKWSRALGADGLAEPKNVPSGLITAFATSKGQTASDGEGVNGGYTSILLKYIRTSGMSIEDLFKKVRVELKKTGQVSVEMSQLTKNFSFNPK